jgi:predicted TIM-barrel fold metal-dependent hydrolase
LTIIDGDGHVVEHDAELLEFLEEPYRSGDNMLNFPFFPSLDGFHRGLGSARSGKKKGHIDAAAWLGFLDEVGIDSTVLYPTAGLGYGLIQDPHWAAVLARGYNNWIHTRYQCLSPRLRGVALIPLQDPPEAVKELRRAVTELGAVGALLPANGGDTGLRKPFGHPDYWPIYAEAEALDCPIAVHGAPSNGLGLDAFTDLYAVAALEHPLPLMIQLTSMVFGGVFQRFPRLRVAYLEAGAGWVPYMMDRLDRLWGVGRYADTTGRAERPSDLLRGGRVFFSCEGGEESLRYAIERIGEDTVLYASDFPHETDVPRAHREIEEMLERADISLEVKRKIFKDNVIRLYGR